MAKSDKDVLYTEVYGVKVGLPQFYDEEGNPVAISTETPMPVALSGVDSIKGEPGPAGKDGKDGINGKQGPQGEPGPAGADASPQFTENEVTALKALINEE